jgi:pimeloyl-ACP methyl ester carboxylesterase
MDRKASSILGRLVLVGLIALLLGACRQAEPAASLTTSPTDAPTAAPTHGPAPTPTHEPTATPSPEPPAASSWEPVDCKFFGSQNWKCGYLVVPEDRSQPGSGMIRLYAVVIPAASDNPKPDPVVFLSGGPGAPAVVAIDYAREILGDLLQDRDLVVFDQRGVGLSEPALDCPEHAEVVRETYGADVSSEEARQRMLDAYRTCRDRLTEEGVNLSAYTSAASAADVHDLMEALGYDRYNLYGCSYGTRLGLTIMRDYPDEVRSAVLDSIGPLQEDALELRAIFVQRTLERVFEQCASSETCNERHPDLAQTFFSLVEKLEKEPLPVKVGGTTYQVGAEEFIELIFMGMYETSGIAGLPNAIKQVADGQTSWLTSQVNTVLSLWSGIIWEGMGLSVMCAEEIPFNSAMHAAEINADLHPAIVRGLEADNIPWLLQVCDMWGAAEANDIEDEPVRVDVPTLILTGEFDPVAPEDFAIATAEYLGKAQSFVIRAQTHDVLSSSTCAREIMKQFLDAPEAAPDSSCLDTLKPMFN